MNLSTNLLKNRRFDSAEGWLNAGSLSFIFGNPSVKCITYCGHFYFVKPGFGHFYFDQA